MSSHRIARPRGRLFAGITALALATVTALGAVASPAAAADPATRPIGGRAVYDERLVTTVDQAVVGTGMTAWGQPLTPTWVVEQTLALQPSIAGATAVIQGDGSLLYTPAPGWSGIDRVRVTSSGAPLGDFVDVHVNVPNGLTNTVGDAHAYVAPNEDGDVVSVLALDPTNTGAEGIAGNSFPAGVVYVTATNGAWYDPANGLLWYLHDDAATWSGATYEYTVWDNDGNGSSGTVTLEKQIPAVLVADQWPPVARVAVSSGPVTLDVLANDVLPPGASSVAVAYATLYPSSGGVGQTTTSVVATGATVTFTPPAGFEGELRFRYSVIDGDGQPVPSAYGAAVDARVIVGDGPVTFKDQDYRSADLPDVKLNPLSVSAGVTTVVDVLANDELAGPATDLVAIDVPDGWTVATTDDMQFAVTAPAGLPDGAVGQFRYRVQDAAGRWSSSAGESASARVETLRAWTVRAHQFTWAGTPITIDPAAGNTAALAAVGADELTFQAPLQTLPGEAVVNADGTLTFTPAAGYTGDVELTWGSNVELGGGLVTTVHVLGPQARDFGITFPVGTQGQVDDLLDGALWGTHADLVTYIDRWVELDAARSRDAVGTVGTEPAGGFTAPGQWSMAQVAIDPPSDLAWPDETLTAELQDPLGQSTFSGVASLRGARLLMASDDVQSSVQTFAALTTARLMGPVAKVLVKVTPVDAPPPVVDPPAVVPPVRTTVRVAG